MSEHDMNEQPSERREFFRIDDQVLLIVRPIGVDEVANIVERITDRVPDRFTVAANFSVNSRAMSRMLHNVGGHSSDTARCLRLLDQKLNHLARLFVLEEVDEGDYLRLNVNLSAGGLVFPSSREFAKDQLLETRMVLYPVMIGILTVARVVYSERSANPGDAYPWQIAIEYLHIRESDRDLLCSHIINRETEILRRQREEAGEE